MISLTDSEQDDLADVWDAVARADRPEAIRLALAAYGRGLGHPLILILVAEAMEENGRAVEALELLRRACELSAEDAEVWRRLGGALARQGLLIPAREALERAWSLNPQTHATLIALAAVCFQSGDLDAAEQLYERACVLDPNNAEPIAARAPIGSASLGSNAQARS